MEQRRTITVECSDCGLHKPLDHFEDARTDGLKYQCRRCAAKVTRRRYGFPSDCSVNTTTPACTSVIRTTEAKAARLDGAKLFNSRELRAQAKGTKAKTKRRNRKTREALLAGARPKRNPSW